MANNVLGTELSTCSTNPLTGFFRDGCCNTTGSDTGMHTICTVMTAEFLLFSKAQGNDLLTARPEYQFPGLKEGDRWCLCLNRWLEALKADCAPKVILEATHASVIEFVDLATLKHHQFIE